MSGSGMPQIRAALGGWMRRITFTRVVQEVVDGFTTSVNKVFTLRGTIQPLNPDAIALKPDGQRHWEWLQVHCLTNNASIVQDNDRITYQGKIFKIMGKLDYSLNGYVEYHAVKDYQDKSL